MKKIMLMILGVLMFSLVSATTLDFTGDKGIYAFTCDQASSLNPSSPIGLPPLCIHDQGHIITNELGFDYSDDVYYQNWGVTMDSDGYYFFQFDLSEFTNITEITPLVEFKATVDQFYWFIYNYDSSSWELLDSVNSLVVEDVVLEGIKSSSLESYMNEEGTVSLLLTEDENNQILFSVDYVSLDVEASSSTPEPNGECDYYFGDDSFNLPQIDIQGTYTNSATHKTYLACLYNLDGTGDYELMSLTDSCRLSPQTFNPSIEGTYEYNLKIAYMIRDWNPTTHQWETTSSGTDNSLDYSFIVCDIPEDDFNEGFLDWINNLLCQWFGWFC